MTVVEKKAGSGTWGAIKQLTFLFLQLRIRMLVLKKDALGSNTRTETRVRDYA